MSWTVHWIESVCFLKRGVKGLNIRKVDRHYNLCFLLPKPIHCGAHYIQVRRPTPGLMGPGSSLPGLIWFGPPLFSKTTSRGVNTIPPFVATTLICWSNLSWNRTSGVQGCGNSTTPSWMTPSIVTLSHPFGLSGKVGRILKSTPPC